MNLKLVFKVLLAFLILVNSTLASTTNTFAAYKTECSILPNVYIQNELTLTHPFTATIYIKTSEAVKRDWSLELSNGGGNIISGSEKTYSDTTSTNERGALIHISNPVPGEYKLKVKETALPSFSCSINKALIICAPNDKKCIDSVTKVGQNPCAGGTCETALGPISTDATEFAQNFLSIGLGLAGGIALIFMVYGSMRVLISGGDPKRVSEGREIIIAAIAGLLFIILSVLILRFIGISLLPSNPFT